ncbi:hypothetical protein ScPMuIL_018657 [Solemya velum]
MACDNSADNRGIRLLSDLNNAFRRDNRIDEYDFIAVLEPKNNRSPLVLVDHKLGLELWSVKILYQYAYNVLLGWRNREPQGKFIEPLGLVHLTRAVLLINPECYTVWNIRKELIESGFITLIEDLKLGALILTKYPKSPETFGHRKWLLRKYLDSYLNSSNGSNSSTNSVHDGFVNVDAIDLNVEVLAGNQQAPVENGYVVLPTSSFQDELRNEFCVCQKAADKYSCNYNAWSHRTWVVQHCYNCSLQVCLAELKTSEQWVQKHISDHSGFHYRQFLFTCLGSGPNREKYKLQVKQLLRKELHLVCDLIANYPGHEALWYHRKYVFQTLHQSCDRSPSAKADTMETGAEEETQVGGHGLKNQKKSRLEDDQQLLVLKELDAVQ